MFALLQSSGKRRLQFKATRGFSLMEVLLIIGMLSVTILPFTLMISQTAGNARGAYIQSTRSIVLNSLMDETSVDRNYYKLLYHTGASNNTNITESGQVIPFRRMVDDQNTGASDTFKKTVYYYLYNNNSDAANAPRYKTRITDQRTTMRVRLGTPNAYVDSSGLFWNAENAYQQDGDALVPGYSGARTLWADATNIVNTELDDELFQVGGYDGTSMNYKVPVSSNGHYTVKLYFLENGQPTRLMDITMEGTLMNPGAPYNAYLASGNRYYCGNVQMFDVYVSDGTLDISLTNNANSGHTNPFISAITIKKRI